MYNNCKETTKPAVDETAEECCGQYPSNCVFMSKEFAYLETEAGDSLTEVLEVVEEKLQNLELNPLPFRDYSALISQTGIADPTSSMAISTFPSTITATLTYSVVGTYTLTFSAPVLVVGETCVWMPSNKPTLFSVEPEVATINSVTIRTYDPTGVLTDGLLDNTPILIRATNV